MDLDQLAVQAVAGIKTGMVVGLGTRASGVVLKLHPRGAAALRAAFGTPAFAGPPHAATRAVFGRRIFTSSSTSPGFILRRSDSVVPPMTPVRYT